MLLSFIIYITLMVLMIVSGRYFINRQYILFSKSQEFTWGFAILIPSLLFALLFGMRYGVGVDHLSYLEAYLIGTTHRMEIGYVFFQTLFQKYNIHFSFFFGFLAFVQIYFFLNAFKNHKYLFAYLVLILFLGTFYTGWMNGIRQSIATCIFIYSIQYIEKRKLIKFLLCILLAISFHKSAIILIPAYLIFRYDIFKIRWLQWGIYIFAIIIYYTSFDFLNLDTYFDRVSVLLKYDSSYTYEDAKILLEANGTGLGFITMQVINFIIIFYAEKMKMYYKSSFFTILYNMFLIGIFGYTAFAGSVVLARPFGYFAIMKLPISAFLLYFLSKSKMRNDKIIYYLFILLYISIFIATIYRGDTNTAEFHFFWEFI